MNPCSRGPFPAPDRTRPAAQGGRPFSKMTLLVSLCVKRNMLSQVYFMKLKRKKKKGWNKRVPSYTFLKRKIHSVLSRGTDLLPWRKSPLKERTLCGTRSCTYWLSAAQHQYTRQGESAPFTVALSCAQGCRPYLFSNAASAEVRRTQSQGLPNAGEWPRVCWEK